MALSHEDKKDVAGAMGKAIANKVSKVTRDRKIYPNGGFGKDKTESYSNLRRSVTNYRPQGEREERIHGHMRENLRKTLGPVGKSIARHEDKTLNRK